MSIVRPCHLSKSSISGVDQPARNQLDLEDMMSQILLLGKESWGQSKSIRGILVCIWMSICRGWDREKGKFLSFSHYPHK